MELVTLKDEFLFDCECRKLSPKTVANYGRQIDYLLNYLREDYDVSTLAAVEPHHIKAFLMRMQKRGCKVNYLNDLLKAFKVIFRYAHEEGYTESILTKKIQNAKGGKTIIRTFSEDELKRMANYYDGHDYLSVRNRLIICLLIDTGIRLSEMTGLTEAQIKSDCILIKGKGNKERVVPKSPLLSKWLIKYMAVRNAYFQYRIVPPNILLSKNGRPLETGIIDRIVKEAGRECNVAFDVRVSAHTFRHTYAQYQLRHGLDIYTLSRLLGHESIAITQTYLQGIRDTEVLEQGRRTSPLMNI